MLKLTSAAAVFSNPSSHIPKSCNARGGKKKKKKLCVAIVTTQRYLDLQPRNTVEGFLIPKRQQ